MSVLNKGMEMPKNCDSCPCYYETEGAWRDECQVLRKECAISEERPSWCPLVEIPPHGRLIDADAPIPLVDTHGKKIEVTVAHIIENNLGIVNAIIEAEDD